MPPIIILILGYAGYFLVALIGMFTHFARKKMKGETVTEVKNYFRTHFRSTLLALAGTIVGFILLVSTDSLNLIAAFLAGFTCDSAFNKWDDKEEEK